MSDCNGADFKENLKENLSNSNKSGRRLCTILSLQPDVTEPAALSKVFIQVWTKKVNCTANLPWKNLPCGGKQNLVRCCVMDGGNAVSSKVILIITKKAHVMLLIKFKYV